MKTKPINTDKTVGQMLGERLKAAFAILDDLDLRTVPILMLFLLILTAAAAANAYAMAFFFPPWLAVMLSFFMEGAALAWKIASERKHNSESQQSLATNMVWLNVLLLAALLVSSLIRAAVHGQQRNSQLIGWDIFAFVVMAISALSTVSGFISYREWDTRIAYKRRLAQEQADQRHSTEWSAMVIAAAAERLKIRARVMNELGSLRSHYAALGLPPDEIEQVLSEAREALGIREPAPSQPASKMPPASYQAKPQAAQTPETYGVRVDIGRNNGKDAPPNLKTEGLK